MARARPAPSRRLDADRWLTEALALLAEAGAAALRVEPLAERLGVSKGSFYWHFADRQALLDGVLAHWRAIATDAVISRVERVDGGPRARLDKLLEICLGSRADKIEAAVRAWSAHDEGAASAIAAVDAAREQFVAHELAALGVSKASARRRSRILYLALIGEFTWCASGGPPSDRAAFTELLELLVGEAPAARSAAATRRAATPRPRSGR